MKYYEVEFTLEPCSQDARDILSALAGEAAFETFEETENGLTGYVQQEMFDQPLLDAVLEGFPFGDTHIFYKVREAEDRDWNEQWEQEGFDPIVVNSRLTIHDGRHLPTETTPLSIEIDARLAFGTGTHETTRMICATLLDSNVAGCNVLDCGCGTGILSICALKLGATSCTAYDIDQWSVENTRHNSVINQVDSRITILHGDATLLDSLQQRFNLVMANINRNILLQDMERFVSVMAPQGTLLLSGFYQQDCALLQSKAQALGLTLQDTRHDGDWACLSFRHS
ncbi:MAG: 50S ribosomal protein L11 methyltransferase [Prevotella sp.]|nr:50S ribosomal protein L11 methyltransferase [Prevotella sp.]